MASKAFTRTSFVLGSTSVAAGYYYIHDNFGHDAIPRLITAYKVAIPAFSEYRKVQFLYETLPETMTPHLPTLHNKLGIPESWTKRLGFHLDDDEATRQYGKLHAVWAPKVLDVFLELRGFYIKTGQMIANNIGDAAPKIWRDVFEPLLDAVPPQSFAHVKRTIEEELGKPMDDIFESFDETPIAAASIGQVHRATLRTGISLNGATTRHVVVKIMYPEVEARFEGDVATSKFFAEIAMPEHVAPLNEIQKQFKNEFDYRREASQLNLVRSNLLAAKNPDFQAMRIPAPILPLCTKLVLVMEEIPNAEKLSTSLERDTRAFADMRGVTMEELIEEEEALNKQALLRGELRNGPSAREMDTYIRARKWRNTLMSPLILCGLAKPLHIPLNHAKLVDDLLAVHGHEIFIDGAFNGDPHPGNLLLSYPSKKKRNVRGTDVGEVEGKGEKSSSSHSHYEYEGDPTLALVDYGQVKILDLSKRMQLARIIVALAKCEDAQANLDSIKKNKQAAQGKQQKQLQTLQTTTTTTSTLQEQIAKEEANVQKYKELVAQRMLETGFRTKKNTTDVVFRLANLYFARDDKLATGGKHIQAYLESMSGDDPIETAADDFVLAGRAALMLRGLGHALNQHRSTAQCWRPFAEACLREGGEEP